MPLYETSSFTMGRGGNVRRPEKTAPDWTETNDWMQMFVADYFDKRIGRNQSFTGEDLLGFFDIRTSYAPVDIDPDTLQYKGVGEEGKTSPYGKALLSLKSSAEISKLIEEGKLSSAAYSWINKQAYMQSGGGEREPFSTQPLREIGFSEQLTGDALKRYEGYMRSASEYKKDIAAYNYYKNRQSVGGAVTTKRATVLPGA